MTSERSNEPLSAAAIANWIREEVATLLDIDSSAIDPSSPLDSYGLASSDAVFLTGELSELLGLMLPATLAWEHPTIDDLSETLARVARGEEELSDDAAVWTIDAGILFKGPPTPG